jgi:uncharacterized protein (DUF2141 family)
MRAIPLAVLIALCGPASAANLEPTVSGLRSDAGRVKIMLFDRADGFPKEDKARAVLTLPATPTTVVGHFRDLPAGRYAVVVYHDENNDGKLNLRFGMFPEEGYGLSNNPEVFGPPHFEDSAFVVPEEGAHIEIGLVY